MNLWKLIHKLDRKQIQRPRQTSKFTIRNREKSFDKPY